METMNWNTATLEDGRQHHHSNDNDMTASVYDWLGGYVDWYVYDSTGNVLLGKGKSASAHEAKLAVEEFEARNELAPRD